MTNQTFTPHPPGFKAIASCRLSANLLQDTSIPNDMNRISTFRRLAGTILFCILLLTGSQWAHAQMLIPNTSAQTQNFDGMGSSATATLPTGFGCRMGTIFDRYYGHHTSGGHNRDGSNHRFFRRWCLQLCQRRYCKFHRPGIGFSELWVFFFSPKHHAGNSEHHRFNHH
jgi:hypothetical protein